MPSPTAPASSSSSVLFSGLRRSPAWPGAVACRRCPPRWRSLPPEVAGPADSVFAALADPTRRRVIETLAGGATVTASGLAVELPISRQAIAKHLATLTRARLVRPNRVGRETRYSLDAAPLEDAARWIVRVGAEWDGRLGELERLLEQRRR